MAIPERIAEPTSADALAVLTRAIFQAGMSWKAIDVKWAAYERLFAAFDPAVVAAFDEFDIERLLDDGGIVRTRKKIVATIGNARALVAIDAEFGGITPYLRAFASYEALARDLRARFAFVGELSAYYVIFRLGGDVPHFETWETTVPGDHPRMREMIAAARATGWTN